MNSVIGINSVSGKRYEYSGPENWNELTARQLVAWSSICIKRGLKLEHAVRLAMMVFYNIKPFKFFMIPECQKVQLAPTLSFLFGKNTLVKWLIPKISDGWRYLHGPEDRLSNISIGEFRRTELYYQALIRTKEQKYLDLLLATLYRPKRKGPVDNDIRIDIREFDIRERASRMSRISRKYRHAILLNYEGCRGYIIEKYPRVFKLSRSPQPSKELFDLDNIIKTVAGGKFGSFAETETTPVYRFFDHLSDQIEECEKLKTKK